MPQAVSDTQIACQPSSKRLARNEPTATTGQPSSTPRVPGQEACVNPRQNPAAPLHNEAVVRFNIRRAIIALPPTIGNQEPPSETSRHGNSAFATRLTSASLLFAATMNGSLGIEQGDYRGFPSAIAFPSACNSTFTLGRASRRICRLPKLALKKFAGVHRSGSARRD
jgi:hypothetical protein